MSTPKVFRFFIQILHPESFRAISLRLGREFHSKMCPVDQFKPNGWGSTMFFGFYGDNREKAREELVVYLQEQGLVLDQDYVFVSKTKPRA